MSLRDCSIRTNMLLNALRRRSLLSSALRHKILILTAVLFLFCWMQIGSLKNEEKKDIESTSDSSLSRVKAKEYPDFDYKYDLRKGRKNSEDYVKPLPPKVRDDARH